MMNKIKTKYFLIISLVLIVVSVLAFTFLMQNQKSESIQNIVQLNESSNESELFFKKNGRVHPESKLALAELRLGGQVFEVELALTSAEQATGLMNRIELAQNKGMFFVFDKPAKLNFWMKNTKIPLDIIFFDEKGELINVQEALPCLADPCPLYSSEKPAKYVLELIKGSAETFGLKPEMSLMQN